jgi:hypothetical protein
MFGANAAERAANLQAAQYLNANPSIDAVNYMSLDPFVLGGYGRGDLARDLDEGNIVRRDGGFVAGGPGTVDDRFRALETSGSWFDRYDNLMTPSPLSAGYGGEQAPLESWTEPRFYGEPERGNVFESGAFGPDPYVRPADFNSQFHFTDTGTGSGNPLAGTPDPFSSNYPSTSDSFDERFSGDRWPSSTVEPSSSVFNESGSGAFNVGASSEEPSYAFAGASNDNDESLFASYESTDESGSVDVA